MDTGQKRMDSTLLKTPPVLPGLPAAYRVFRNSGFRPLAGRRGVLLLILALLPVILMATGRLLGFEKGGGYLFFMQALLPFYHYINLIVFIFLGCSILGESIESRTLTYDLICPVSRKIIYGGRYVSYLASALVIIIPVLWTAYLVSMVHLGGDVLVRYLPSLFAISAMSVVAAMIYGSFFILLSFLIKRSVLVAIVMALVFDGFLAYIPLKIANLSVLVHLRNMMYALSGDSRFQQMFEEVSIQVTPASSLMVLIALWLVFTLGGMWVFSRKQFL